jgi:uncharacterized protein
MSTATFRVHGVLERFITRARRGAACIAECARAASLKHAIEALGMPHTEVGRVTVNGTAATLDRTVREGDDVEVFPHAPGSAPFVDPLAFVADAQLGGLARMLRMLGFDTLYDHALADPQVVTVSRAEHRVVLTRDRELLKCRDVMHGAYVHALKPEAQLREVDERYGLAPRAQPFTLCLCCNVLLIPASAEQIAACVPRRIQGQYRTFIYCARCSRVYWEGSHWVRMRELLATTMSIPATRI